MKNDSYLHYNVGEWTRFGLAVPNFGNDKYSQNDTIRDFVDIIGRNLQNIMWHPDSRMRTPPSINTLQRIHKLCTRARSLFAARAVPAGTLNMEAMHALPAPEEFRVYPTPYFNVRNQWMRNYAGLTLLALTEAMQHQENAKPLEISENFAALVGQFIHRIYRSMAVELFGVSKDEASQPDYVLTDEVLRTYNPSKYFTSTEMIDTVPDLMNWPTEDDLQPLTDGIYISHLPVLGRYPNTASTASGSSASSIVIPESRPKFYPPHA